MPDRTKVPRVFTLDGTQDADTDAWAEIPNATDTTRAKMLAPTAGSWIALTGIGRMDAANPGYLVVETVSGTKNRLALFDHPDGG